MKHLQCWPVLPESRWLISSTTRQIVSSMMSRHFSISGPSLSYRKGQMANGNWGKQKSWHEEISWETSLKSWSAGDDCNTWGTECIWCIDCIDISSMETLDCFMGLISMDMKSNHWHTFDSQDSASEACLDCASALRSALVKTKSLKNWSSKWISSWITMNQQERWSRKQTFHLWKSTWNLNITQIKKEHHLKKCTSIVGFQPLVFQVFQGVLFVAYHGESSRRKSWKTPVMFLIFNSNILLIFNINMYHIPVKSG